MYVAYSSPLLSYRGTLMQKVKMKYYMLATRTGHLLTIWAVQNSKVREHDPTNFPSENRENSQIKKCPYIGPKTSTETRVLLIIRNPSLCLCLISNFPFIWALYTIFFLQSNLQQKLLVGADIFVWMWDLLFILLKMRTKNQKSLYLYFPFSDK